LQDLLPLAENVSIFGNNEAKVNPKLERFSGGGFKLSGYIFGHCVQIFVSTNRFY
jgi:hypothetical protein